MAVTEGTSAPYYIPVFGDGLPSGISEMMKITNVNPGVWYTLDGRKLQQKPAKKGVYILNGRKMVVK